MTATTDSTLPEHAKVTDLVARLDDRIGELRRHL
ncbi:hypothetical protein ENSA5_63910 [Enhygromyxa salina]|uniref:Uncharacterized protein n=1 Tax=Enhygromyxa salina TaxID=215803 RepID=A0A2S9XCK7_9BACT|nr:hypothetical protein ENSA5_63910 [Enhygromyxa salina]